MKLEGLVLPKVVTQSAAQPEKATSAGRAVGFTPDHPNADQIKRILGMNGDVELDPVDKSVAKVWLDKTNAGNDELKSIARLAKLR